ncbi:MAG: FAD-dependent oxidoreductase [Planctomycetes bacterium]|nr:FAD-dependent oxidoreductase [Planctomycetota bacterium]
MKPIVIVGAGISGLTTAYALQKTGRKVVVLERATEVGGLARSLEVDGAVYDIGPHYFFLKTDPRADALVMEALQEKAKVIDFQVSMIFRGHNIAWPPNLASLRRLPFSNLLLTVKNNIRRRFPAEKDCEGFITRFFGRALFEAFMGPYLQKKIPCLGPAKLHREWWLQVGRDIHNRYPSKGADQTKRIESRTHVPLKVKTRAFLKMALGLIRTIQGKNLRKVLYPEGGMGGLCEALAAKFQAAGGGLIMNCGPVKVMRSENRISSVECDGASFDEPETLVWTGSIHELMDQMGMGRPNLPFVNIVLAFVKIKGRLDLPPYLYTYYAHPDLIFNRAYFPRLITSGLVPQGQDAICLEISKDDRWSEDGGKESKVREAIIEGLDRVSLCRPDQVETLALLDVPEAYPAYPIDYYEILQTIWDDLRQVENLWSIGRSAQFYYNNMARAMGVALDLSEYLSGQKIFPDLG